MSSKTFKYSYDNNPEFRRKHLDKMMEKVKCNCGFVTTRNNLTKHKRSRNHLKRITSGMNLKELKELKKHIENSVKKLQL